MSDPLTCQLQTPTDKDDNKEDAMDRDPIRAMFNRYADQVCYFSCL